MHGHEHHHAHAQQHHEELKDPVDEVADQLTRPRVVGRMQIANRNGGLHPAYPASETRSMSKNICVGLSMKPRTSLRAARTCSTELMKIHGASSRICFCTA